VALQTAAIHALSVLGLPTNEDGSLDNESGVVKSLEHAVAIFLRPFHGQLTEKLLERARQQRGYGASASFETVFPVSPASGCLNVLHDLLRAKRFESGTSKLRSAI
jgi:hypothetical protein